MKENIIIADCKKEEIETLKDGLSKNGRQYVIKSHPANFGRTGALSELKRYANYFGVSFQYFLYRNRYEDIVCWQQFYALIFGFYCNLFHVKKKNKVVAFNFTYKEKKKFTRLYRWFMGKCLSKPYVDYIHVLSNQYAEIISREFHFPKERIIVTAFGIDDSYEKYCGLDAPVGYTKSGYMLALGRSNRDFDFLIRAWKDIQYPLVIISDAYKVDTNNPNICIKRTISGELQYPWLVNCKALIIPVDDGRICSGDTVLLSGLSLKKIVLVTEPSTLAEMYVNNGENGLIVKKDADCLRNIVNDIVGGKYDYIEDNARRSFLENYSRYSLGAAVAGAI